MSKAPAPAAPDSDTEGEIAQRLDRALQRAFSMPHKAHEPLPKKPKARQAKRKVKKQGKD